MAAAIIDVYRALDQWAPFDTQMDFDNAGFLVGRGEREVRRVLVSLDITEAVARARGTVDMYYRLNDPEYRGDVVGFNMRGVATPVTGKYLGAIYSPKA